MNTLNLKFPKDFFKDYARGKPCMIRVAAAGGFQCADVDTTVLCHPSIAGLKAMGSRKASVPDIGGAWGCVVCHDLCDGRRKPARGSHLEELAGEGAFLKMVLQNAILEGATRTIDALVKAGVLPNP
jgi:hypothetical protein